MTSHYSEYTGVHKICLIEEKEAGRRGRETKTLHPALGVRVEPSSSKSPVLYILGLLSSAPGLEFLTGSFSQENFNSKGVLIKLNFMHLINLQ